MPKKAGKGAEGLSEAEILENVKDVASRSGRPLEVVAARSFLEVPGTMAEGLSKKPWTVDLGSYFEDGEKVRELDVLARRQHYIKDPGGFNCVLEAFVSCKGFQDDEHPVAYTVKQKLELEPKNPPLLLTTVGPSPARYTKLGVAAVQQIFSILAVDFQEESFEAVRTVGFEVAKEPQEGKKDWRALGDRNVFEGLDSALRAALFWKRMQLPPNHSTNEYLVRVQIPILVLQRPWYAISIDDGTVGIPVKTSLGYTASLYPLGGGAMPVPMFMLLVARESLPDLQRVLTSLFGWMWTAGTQALRNPS